MLRSILAGLVIILPALSASVAMADETEVWRCEDAAVTPTALCSAVATGRQPVIVHVQGEGGHGAALEVTARPLATDISTPFLVQVYVSKTGHSIEKPLKLLGSFSFFPVRIGQVQTFVLPKPASTGGVPVNDMTLAIRLIPANPARDLTNAAVEIMSARVID